MKAVLKYLLGFLYAILPYLICIVLTVFTIINNDAILHGHNYAAILMKILPIFSWVFSFVVVQYFLLPGFKQGNFEYFLKPWHIIVTLLIEAAVAGGWAFLLANVA